MLCFILLFGIIYKTVTPSDCPIVSNPVDRRSNSSKFRFVQFNVEWLFLDYYESADCPGNGCPWHNTTAAEIHLDYIANVIDALNPDSTSLRS